MCARLEGGGVVARRTRKGLTAEVDFEQAPKAVQEEEQVACSGSSKEASVARAQPVTAAGAESRVVILAQSLALVGHNEDSGIDLF